MPLHVVPRGISAGSRPIRVRSMSVRGFFGHERCSLCSALTPIRDAGAIAARIGKWIFRSTRRSS
jgi:hypothetical protein